MAGMQYGLRRQISGSCGLSLVPDPAIQTVNGDTFLQYPADRANHRSEKRMDNTGGLSQRPVSCKRPWHRMFRHKLRPIFIAYQTAIGTRPKARH
jgi:hypothetical protein